ncbi:MAG: ATP-binding protein [Cellulosilyticaceae bacterium]
MGPLWSILWIIMGLVEVTILVRLFDVFLIKKNQEIYKKLISSFLVCMVLYFILGNIPQGFYKYIIAIFLGTVLACCLYEGSLLKKVLITTMFVISSVGLESLVVISCVEFSLMDMNNIVVRNTEIVLLTVVTKSIQFIGINLMRRLKNKKNIKFNFNEILIYIAPCSTIVIVSIIIKYQIDSYKPIQQVIAIVLVCMGLFISNVFIGLMFERMIEQDRERRRYEEIQDKVKKQYKYYRNIESRQEESRKLWHDINNHLGCIRQLIDNHHPEEATEYLNKINSSINRLRGNINTGNLILDAVLNDKYEIAQMNSINIALDIDDIDIDFVDSIDICTIYSNLLDNAIEACTKLPENKREIAITSKLIKRFIVIKITNTLEEKITIKNNRIVTSKADKYSHGIGLLNVCETIEKYEGNITMDCENNKFITNILLPIK